MESITKLINGFQVRKVIAYKTRENDNWKHHVYDRKFFWKTIHYDYWAYKWCDRQFTTEEMIEALGDEAFYKDGVVYYYPSIDFIFSSRQSTSIYFKTDSAMLEYLEKFQEQFDKAFIIL